MKFEDGKYEVVFDERGIPQQVLRNEEPWRDLVGDKFMYLVLTELRELRTQKEATLEVLDTISGFTCYLRQGGADVSDIDGLEYAVQTATNLCYDILKELQ